MVTEGGGVGVVVVAAAIAALAAAGAAAVVIAAVPLSYLCCWQDGQLPRSISISATQYHDKQLPMRFAATD